MSRKVYNKLVRSEIPDIIKSEGRECVYIELETSDETERKIVKNLLKEKVLEEAKEVLESKNRGELLEEIGDLLDVIDELLRLECFDMHKSYNVDFIKQNLQTIRSSKNITKGKFKSECQNSYHLKYIKLLSVDDEN
jgi:predicted house-cleaning noncanonical NTP pyrophosphatase (MazG superfamily)